MHDYLFSLYLPFVHEKTTTLDLTRRGSIFHRNEIALDEQF